MNALKKKLHTLDKLDWDLTDVEDITTLVFEAMSAIGTTDSEFRESIFSLLYTAIVNDHLEDESLKILLHESMATEHGHAMLGAVSDDSVFDRSFSMLVTRWIVHHHRTSRKQLLTGKELEDILAFTCDYTIKEVDYRGYTHDKGWAHSIAHAATTLRTLALCEEIDKAGLEKILMTIQEKVSIYEHVYVADEMERWTMCVMNSLRRNLVSDDDMEKWIMSFINNNQKLESHDRMNLRINQTNFLRSLYFRCSFKAMGGAFMETLYQTIQDINTFHNEMEE